MLVEGSGTVLRRGTLGSFKEWLNSKAKLSLYKTFNKVVYRVQRVSIYME